MHRSNAVSVRNNNEEEERKCSRIGNLGRIDYINDNEYDLFIRPDTCCPRFRCWFLFTVENVKADQVRKKIHFPISTLFSIL